MKKYIFKSLFLLLGANVAFAQTTATDFTTNDCDGITHNLFDSLDEGNVIVIAWVMPCGGCITPSLAAYDAAQTFAISHPGIVDFYLVDDYANTSCASLVNWGNSNSMPLNTAFSSSAISMSDYGSAGMPKVVVLGGSSHSVYYNLNNNQIKLIGVQAAINNALAAPLNIDENKRSIFEVSTFPNPAKGVLNIQYELKNSDNIRFEIVSILGKKVLQIKENKFSTTGTNNKKIDISSLEKGIYFLNAYSGSDVKTTRFIVGE